MTGAMNTMSADGTAGCISYAEPANDYDPMSDTDVASDPEKISGTAMASESGAMSEKEPARGEVSG